MEKTLELLTSAVSEVCTSWEQEAAQRKARTPSDPAAETLVSCATEMKARLEQLERETALLSVAQFAKARGVDESTVRRLCARGQIEGAEKGIDGEWLIPRDARRVKTRVVEIESYETAS